MQKRRLTGKAGTGGTEDPEKVPGEEVHLTLKLTSLQSYIVFYAGHFWEPGHRGDTCLLAFVALLGEMGRYTGVLPSRLTLRPIEGRRGPAGASHERMVSISSVSRRGV